MVEYSKLNVKSWDRLPKQRKEKTGPTLTMSLKTPSLMEIICLMNCYWQQDKKANLRNAFNNNMSTDWTLSKAQSPKLIQYGKVLGSLLSKLACPLMKVAMPLAKNILASLGITSVASAIDAETQKKIHGSGCPSFTTLIISNKEMNEIMESFRLFKILLFCWKESLKQLKTKQKNKKEDS